MGFFGMAIQEVINNRRDTQILIEKVEFLERESDISKKEAKLIIKEANLNAEKIINDAEAKAKNLFLKNERIEKLFRLASECHSRDPVLADRYVELARKIGMKCQVRIPKRFKMCFCKECNSFLVPGVSSRIRNRHDGKGKVIITCLKCGMIKRYPMNREKIRRKKDFIG